MIELPRIALAVPPSGPEPSVAGLALMAALTSRGTRVQHFRARACPFSNEVVQQATGLPGRHLDAWLMPPDVCGQLFVRGARNADLALVEGTLIPQNPELGCPSLDRPGELAPLTDALQLPTIAVVPVTGLDNFHLPHLPETVDAVLLDGLVDENDFDRFAHLVRLITKRPVVGAIGALPEDRRALACIPRDCQVPSAILGSLGASFLKFADLAQIQSLARSRALPIHVEPPRHSRPGRFRVAYALDEAFGGYFPDTLETLETLGAELIEFSPLRDEALPVAVDLVMIGCGHPELFIEDLAGNVSMIASLRAYVCRGQRIYSEGGGTAYLGQSLQIGGRIHHGAGILPFEAVLRDVPESPKPVERRLTCDTWLGPRGTLVRGYRSGRWDLRTLHDPCGCAARCGCLTDEEDIHFLHHAVGGLLHLHLAALPEVVAAFVGPHRPSLTLRPGDH